MGLKMWDAFWTWLRENHEAISSLAAMIAAVAAAGGWICTVHSHRFLTGPKIEKVQKTLDDFIGPAMDGEPDEPA